jgi:hypothetical protein
MNQQQHKEPKEAFMLSIFRTLIDRFKALFMTHALLELEADLVALGAECKAQLLRCAEQFEKEGLKGVAQEIRRQAEALAWEKPLVGVQAIIAHLRAEPLEMAAAIETAPRPRSTEAQPAPTNDPLARQKKKTD